MRFSWTLNELHALRAALIDAQFFHSDLQERLEENGEDKTDRYAKSRALQRNHELLGSKVLSEIVRRNSVSKHRKRGGNAR